MKEDNRLCNSRGSEGESEAMLQCPATGINDHPLVLRSSLSDNGRYPDFCWLAAHDSNVFKGFRTSAVYREILEHVTEQQGVEYLAALPPDSRARSLLVEAVRNDLQGVRTR